MFATTPDRWDGLPTDQLADALAQVDRDALDDVELVAVLAAHQRLINHHMAHRARLMVEVCERFERDARTRIVLDGEFAHLEVGTALTLTRRKAQVEVQVAYAVVQDFPLVLAALGSGSIDWAKAIGWTSPLGLTYTIDPRGP